jgi:hypothetical protein
MIKDLIQGKLTLIWEWYPIILTSDKLPNHSLQVFVMTDAMKIESNNKLVRFPVTAIEQQQIADLIGGIFHTTKTADQRHLQATTKLRAITQVPPGSGKITALASYIEYSSLIDTALVKTNKSNFGLISTVGKPWTLHNGLLEKQHIAFNYGWHDEGAIYKSPIDLKIWQPIAGSNSKYVHNDQHKDPSQICEMPSRDAILTIPNGKQEQVDLASIYQDKDLWSLVSYDGPLKLIRQPNVEQIKGKIILPQINV